MIVDAKTASRYNVLVNSAPGASLESVLVNRSKTADCNFSEVSLSSIVRCSFLSYSVMAVTCKYSIGQEIHKGKVNLVGRQGTCSEVEGR